MKSPVKHINSEIEFTDEQITAIEYPIDNALKIVAGAGTGKTTVLSYRYLHLVKEEKINIENILALTFTKKAANNFRKKISEILDDDYAMLNANIYNFDSLWLRFVIENIELCGIDSDFRIMDDTERLILREKIIDEMIADTDKDFIMSLKKVNLTDIKKILNNGFKIIDSAKNKLIGEKSFEQIVLEKIEKNKKEFKEDDNYEIQIEYAGLYSRLYKNYQKKIIKEKYLDFSDVVMKAYYLLKENPQVAGKYRKKFRYILIDEMQDTSYGQLEILKLIAEDGFRNVTVVGDDKQSIFCWRDAEIENIRKFPGEEKYLRNNRRSYNEILELSNFTIFQDSYFEKKRESLELKNDVKGHKNDIAVKMFCAKDREEEAEFVANEIIKINNEGVSLNNIAVLFRSRTYFKIFENVFRRKDIPYISIGGGYFDNDDIKDIIAYLKLLNDPFDIPSFIRILENEPYSLSLDSMMKIGNIIKKSSEEYEKNNKLVNVFEIFEKILNNNGVSDFAKNKILSLKKLLDSFIMKKDKLSLANLTYSLLEENEYFKMLYTEDDSILKNRINILKNVYLMSQQYEKRYENSTLSDFVKYLEYKIKDEWSDDELIEETDKENVVFLTIHKAKGLEYDYIFYCDIRDKDKPRNPPIVLDVEKEISDGTEKISGYGLVLRYKNADNSSKKDKAEIFEKAVERMKFAEKQVNEEIRLKHVALTRAKEMLYLTATLSKGVPPKYYQSLFENFSKKEYVKIITESKKIDNKINLSKRKDPGKINVEEKVEKILKEYNRKVEKVKTPQESKILKLDFSMIKNYNHCPLKYKYIYECKFPVNKISLYEKETGLTNSKSPDDKSSRLIFGICIHKVLENYYDLKEPPELFLKRLMLGYGIKEKDYEEKFEDRCIKVFENFRKFALDKSSPKYTEKEFNLWYGDFDDHHIHFKGLIDRIDKRNGIWEIADYKTGFKGSTINLRDDEIQMQIYDLAVSEGVFEDVENPVLMIYFLEEGKSHRVKREPKIKDIILSTADNIIKKRFDVNEEIHKNRDCWNCEFGGLTGFCKKNLLSLKRK